MSALPSRPRPSPIIHINAFPGTGKLTICHELLALLRPPHAKLVHNHLLINPVDAILDRTQPGYQTLRRSVRAAIFHALAHEASTHATAYIFTDFQSSNELGAAVCREYAVCASERGSDFVPVLLHCDVETNLERLVAGDRAQHQKLVDVDLARRFRKDAELYRFAGHPAAFELDVTSLSPREAAGRILEHVTRHCPELKPLITTEP